MHSIKVTIRDRIAQAEKKAYICGNGDFVVEFDFDSEWESFSTKTARFKYDDQFIDVVFTGNTCNIPKIYDADIIRVGVFAGDLVVTTPAMIIVSKSILRDGGVPADPPNDVYNQIMQRLNELGTPNPEAIAAAVADYIAANPIEEKDPTVPSWAKEVQKPSYTADEVGALSAATLPEAIGTALTQAKASGEFDGADGKSAYQYAVGGGYTGTEAEFAVKLAQEMPDKLPNPNALTFTGAVTGSYDGSAPLSVEIPSGGSGGSAEPGYKDATTLFDVTLDDTTGGLKSYEYDVSGIEKTDVIIINILFPASYAGTITIKNQADAILTNEFPYNSKGMIIVLKIMNGRYMHSCVSSGNISARVDVPLSLFYGQISGASGFGRPKAPDTITKLKFTLTAEFVSGTRIRACRW